MVPMSVPLSHVFGAKSRAFVVIIVSHSRPQQSHEHEQNLKQDRPPLPSICFSAHLGLRTELCVTTYRCFRRPNQEKCVESLVPS